MNKRHLQDATAPQFDLEAFNEFEARRQREQWIAYQQEVLRQQSAESPRPDVPEAPEDQEWPDDWSKAEGTSNAHDWDVPSLTIADIGRAFVQVILWIIVFCLVYAFCVYWLGGSFSSTVPIQHLVIA